MTFVESVAARFRSAPGVWIDGKELAKVGGGYAWRSRVSDLRRAPFHMAIENRVRTEEFMGTKYAVSEYRFVPAAVVAPAPAEEAAVEVPAR